MDGDIENIHKILLDAQLPSTISDIRNPTEEYVINLLTSFLARFQVDTNALQKPTFEQLQKMYYAEAYDSIIGIVNLKATISGISTKLFLKDFSLTDITSPGPKLLRRQAKFISNFVIYSTNKLSDINDDIQAILNRRQTLEDLIKEKNDVIEKANREALYTSKQLAKEEKLKKEIKEVRQRVEANKRKKTQLESTLKETQNDQREVATEHGALKAKALKEAKLIAKLEADVVTSPEDYRNHLQQLEQQSKEKSERRENMQEAISAKNNLIEKLEKIMAFVQEQHGKFPEIKNTLSSLKDAETNAETMKKKVEELDMEIAKIIQEMEQHENQYGSDEIKEIRA
ncbi:probable kinetochore protein nuf2 isoform X2 [Cephus cinctus]|nr:probable kinetochore protein nuf2 isoform X2 [Cephus cinctus]